MANQLSSQTLDNKEGVIIPSSISSSTENIRLIEKDTSHYLARLNKVQQELLSHELHGLRRQQERVLREAHLQMCEVAKDRIELRREKALNIQKGINSQGKSQPLFPVISEGSPRFGRRNDTKKKTGEHQNRRTSVSDINGLVADGVSLKPTSSMSRTAKSTPDLNVIKDNNGQIVTEVNTVTDEQSTVSKDKPRESFMDYKRKEEIARLKRNSLKNQNKWVPDKSIDRSGMPLLPISSFAQKRSTSPKPSKSVFDRLSKGSKTNTMTSDVFFRNVKIQATRRPVSSGRHALTPLTPQETTSADNALLSPKGLLARRARSVSPRPRQRLEIL